MLYRSAEKPLCGLGWRSVRCWFRHRDGGNYRTCLPRVNSRNCRSERPVDHDHRNDAEHCHAEEHSQGQVLHAALADPGWREAALAVRTPAITGRARRNRATSAASVPFKRSGSWQPKMPCSLGTGPLSGHPLNERTATEALKRKGMATKMTMSRATSIPYSGDAVHALKDPTLAGRSPLLLLSPLPHPCVAGRNTHPLARMCTGRVVGIQPATAMTSSAGSTSGSCCPVSSAARVPLTSVAAFRAVSPAPYLLPLER